MITTNSISHVKEPDKKSYIKRTSFKEEKKQRKTIILNPKMRLEPIKINNHPSSIRSNSIFKIDTKFKLNENVYKKNNLNLKDEKKEDNKEQNPEITPNDTKKSEGNNDRKSRLQARLAKSKAALKKKEEEMKYRASAKIKSKASLYEDKLPKKDEV